MDEGIDTYEFGETARALYDFFWNEFCDWYIELAKGRLNGGDAEQRASVQRILVFVLDQALRLLHPMMPFVTEAIWRNLPLAEKDAAPSLMVASWPDAAALARFADPGAEASIGRLIDVVVGVRAVRARYTIPPKRALDIVIRTTGDAENQWVNSEFGRMASLAGVGEFDAGHRLPTKPAHSATVLASGMEIYIPLEGLVDFDAERERLAKERDKAAVELEPPRARSCRNEGFLAKAAPEIVEKDRARADELGDQLALIDAQLVELA